MADAADTADELIWLMLLILLSAYAADVLMLLIVSGAQRMDRPRDKVTY